MDRDLEGEVDEIWMFLRELDYRDEKKAIIHRLNTIGDFIVSENLINKNGGDIHEEA